MKAINFTNDYALLNFNGVDLTDKDRILNSKSFVQVFKNYYKKLKEKDSHLVKHLKGISPDLILDFYRLLVKYELKTVLRKQEKITKEHILTLYDLTEGFYDYWRKFERYGLISGATYSEDDLLRVSNEFNNLVISTYRNITQKLLGEKFNVYRQLPAGLNANILYVEHKFKNNSTYSLINDIPFVTKMVINPPFIINSKSNTRRGSFQPLTFSFNPINRLKINKRQFIAFPLYIGPLLAFVYIHLDYMHHGIALSNLFEFADEEVFKEKKPDLIYVFGVEEETFDNKYYHDTVNDIYLGFVMRSEENDYFGYLKKMLLTLHNLYMIDHNYLPIHGAMVQITLGSNKKKNVVIVGDSGAGKSETLEALRQIASHDLKDIKVIFDDMGTFKIKNDTLVASGTETGAFVRLDDLEQGYAYEIMDRALFMNPSHINSRVVIPVSRYDFIVDEHPIDLVLYANNYENKDGIKLFKKVDDAINVFKQGVRKAKGTTNEVGLTKTYFANPFGPMQRSAQTDVLIQSYFNLLFKNGISVGEVYTKLAVPNEELRGPSNAAIALLKLIDN